MTKFEEQFEAKYNPLTVNEGWAPGVEEKYPMLCSAICGNPKWKPGSPGLPPLTLMIFARDGSLRCSLSSPLSPRSFYATISDPRNLLESVEEAIDLCKGEWVTKRDK